MSVINPIQQPTTASVEETPIQEANYLILIQRIVGKVLDQLTRIAEKNRVQTENQKHKYTQANQEWANHQKSLGNVGVYSTAATLMILGASILLDTKLPMELVQKGPDTLANVFSSRTQSKQRMADSVSALSMNEMNVTANKAGNDSNSKDQMTRLLEQAYEAQRRAAQAG